MQRQESLKRRWHDSFYTKLLTPPPPPPPLPPVAVAASSSSPPPPTPGKPKPALWPPGPRRLLGGEDEMAALRNVVPAVTVVVEGRSICHRINLHHHPNYHSLAKALRHLFINHYSDDNRNYNHIYNHGYDHNQVVDGDDNDEGVDLSNAVPGHLVAYEDLENDLLLVGDLSWKDFVRVAKRIRIIPVKSNSRKQRIMKNWSISSPN